ncbi:peptide/nickel transport system permease protein [Nitratireductor aquibiodomus]|uniref:Peptide/nickel transport system permease protein n=2 Tax=Nitratireductor aquibiodomus TaxID=204799 RepID=A0A1H4JU91_9HYPH|nr:peptide/nickel transport system permease protein [Nitratireductor aquibiodomus]
MRLPRRGRGGAEEMRFRFSSGACFSAAALAAGAVLLALVMFLPPYVTGPDTLSPPGREHWLGTNDIGQDVLTGLLRAAPTTVGLALIIAASALLIGFLLAAIAAGLRGLAGGLVLRIADIMEIIPSILILLLFAAWVKPDAWGLVLLIALTTWHDDVRPLRAILLRELSRENVALARLMGASWPYLLVRHVAPALWPTLAAIYVQNAVQAVMRVAGLSFLGLVDPRLLTWGGMIQDAVDYLHEPAWVWLLLPPAFCLSAFLFVLLGIGRRLEESAAGVRGQTL